MMLAVYLCNIINYNLGILNQPVPELFSYNENRAGYEIGAKGKKLKIGTEYLHTI